MFILECKCGNEIYCTQNETCMYWQCDACGTWYNIFGIEENPQIQQQSTFKDFDPDYEY